MIDENKIYHELTSIKERLSAHTVIMNDILTPSIAKIESHLTLQNGDMGQAKKDIVEIKTNCAFVQEKKKETELTKKEKRSNLYKSIGIGLTLIGLLFGAFKLLPNKVEKEIMFVKQVNDSMMVIIPAIDIRSQTEFKLDTISSMYFKIEYQ